MPGAGAPLGATAYVAFDLEATGLSPKADRIIEIGAVRYNAELERVGELELLVDPSIPIPLAVQRLVGITSEDVRGAPSPPEAVAQLADFCAGAELVTHGGAFDMHFVTALAPDAFRNRDVYDTLELARILLPSFETHALQQLSRRLGLPHTRPHRALSDAEATGALFALLMRRAQELPRSARVEMRRVADPAGAPLGTFFRATAEFMDGEKAGGGAKAVPRAGAVHPAPERAGGPARAVMAAAAVPLDEAAATALGPGGPLDTGDGYEYREPQVQMARAVSQSIERHRRLLVEAGTGVGKSLAYLVPLALWTARRHERAVVATHTVNLQEQLADRDLPRLASVVDPPPATAVLKGRSHYISLRRWMRFLAHPDGSSAADRDAIRFKLKVLVWLTETESGDRAELHLTGDEEGLWRRIASDREDCLGAACANWPTRRCFMVAARRRAADADIVVTNHSLLLADSERQGQVLTPYSVLVVDEAHQLETSATEQLGTTVRPFDVAMVLDRIPARPGTALAAALARCREASQRLFGDIKGFVTGQLGLDHASNTRMGLSEAVRGGHAFQPLARAARLAAGALGEAAALLEEADASESLQAELLPEEGRDEDEATLQAFALRDLRDSVERIVLEPRAEYVCWLELRAEQGELHEAPVSVAEPLRRMVYDRCDSTVLTSATLTVAGSFDFMRARLGAGEAADELALPSPFDYLGNALCVLVGGVPPYDDPQHDVVVAELTAQLALDQGGRTLVLFTSYGPLRRVHALIAERLERRGIALLGQGIDGTRRQILRSFLEDPRTVLLGTSSFWEGVDIPGERLRCVVIDKLPFPVPTDPLVRARSAGMRDAFAQYSLPIAVLRLRQGFGRLIRGQDDRGAVVLCDERLQTRDYADVFLRALPPAEQLRCDVDMVPSVVNDFMKRVEHRRRA
ncbi:MAG: DEAD/DEAH box helicase family protein [Candidatus Dormibacteraeota bacterium]|nr:DEAD/DEAH box helicase family protein [Candidatus Dormibacteraeota bacterium]